VKNIVTPYDAIRIGLGPPLAVVPINELDNPYNGKSPIICATITPTAARALIPFKPLK
tara:strand:- start:263 stop:436 length:174 start_codon:yes stop_codon:yes gene_type:complete